MVHYNSQKRPLRRVLAVALSALLACSLTPTAAFAQADAGINDEQDVTVNAVAGQRVVRVGYMDQVGVLHREDDGSFSGYTYEYLNRIAQFTGWAYEFVEAEGADDNERAMRLIEMLQNGEVDIEGSMTYSSSLAEVFEYPSNSYGEARTCLMTSDGGNTITSTGLYTKGQLRVALFSTAKQRREELVYFCEKNDLKLVTVECETLEEMKEKVESGEADAFLDVDVNVHEGFHIVASFVGRPYYFAAPKGQHEIIDEIDETIQRINESNPALRDTLYQQYFEQTESNFALTQEQLEFCRQHDTLRVGIISEKAPVQSFDPTTGELEGVTRGLLDHLSETTGLSFEIVPLERTDNLAAALRDNDIDLVAGVNKNESVSASLGLSLTASYLTASLLTVYNKYVDPDELEGKTYAVPWELASTAPSDADVKVYDSIEECLQAVDSGKADYTYCTSYIATYYQGVDTLNNVLTLPVSTQAVSMSFGIVQPVEPELLVVFNKTIRGLSGAELDTIIYENALVGHDEQLDLFVRDHLLELSLAFISILLLVIALLALYVRTRSRAARAAREENLRFQELFALSNEQFFEYSIRTDTLRVAKNSGPDFVMSEEGEDRSNSDDLPYSIVKNARERIAGSPAAQALDALTAPDKTVTEMLIEYDGKRHWVRITSHTVNDENGKPISVVGKITDIDDEMREKLDLSERAHHDGLTGLLNWKTFKERTELLMSRGQAGALLIMDTDDFKSVNDLYGHLAGDVALQHTAQALQKTFRPRDLVGRLGGDEFAVCIDGAVSNEIIEKRCAEIVRNGVAFADDEGTEHTVTLSVGGIQLHGQTATYREAYQQADKALYRAKADGKDRFVVEPYDPNAAAEDDE